MSEFFDMLMTERQKIKGKKNKSPTKRSSPLKQNDENASPDKGHHSQRRRQKDDDGLGIYLEPIKQDSEEKEKTGG